MTEKTSGRCACGSISVGHLIRKPFKPDVEQDGWLVTVVGIAFWAVAGAAIYVVYVRARGAGQ